MKQLTILFLLFIVQNVVAQDVSKPKDENGMKKGHWIIYGKDRPESGFPAEAKVEEGNYVNDRKEGVWIKYYEDGVTIKLKGEFKNNRANGYYTKYYPNGKLKERGYFTQNKNLDTLERFFESGKPEFFAVYDSIGKEHGTIRKYNPDGSLACEYEAVHGTIPNAPPCVLKVSETPDPHLPSDTITLPAQKKLDTPEKRSCFPETVPNEIKQDGTFRDGKLWDGKKYIYDQDGILLKVEIYKNGLYHSDGQL